MAIDWAGRWYEDPNVPEEKWNDFDYMAWYIRKNGYEPKNEMESLIEHVLTNYQEYLKEHEVVAYVSNEDRRPYPMCLMVNWNDVGAFVRDSGGWEEFDYSKIEVYVLLYHNCTEELDETDVIGVYSSLDDARKELKSFMDDVYLIQSNYYGADKFDSDFLVQDEDYYSFGFNGQGYTGGCVWAGRIEKCTLR